MSLPQNEVQLRAKLEELFKENRHLSQPLRLAAKYIMQDGVKGLGDFLERLAKKTLTQKDLETIRLVYYPDPMENRITRGEFLASIAMTGVTLSALFGGAMAGYQEMKGQKADNKISKKEVTAKQDAALIVGGGSAVAAAGLYKMIDMHVKKRIQNMAHNLNGTVIDTEKFKEKLRGLLEELDPILPLIAEHFPSRHAEQDSPGSRR